MKTLITSNWRPLLRALSAFLIAITGLCAMPRNANAQVYVTQLPSFPSLIGVVAKYDQMGRVINARFITGLNQPKQLALSGDTLFVVNFTGNTVGKYDANTGTAINPSFITRLNHPVGLTVNGNTLFVTNLNDGTDGSGTVGTYDATTGAVINASFIRGLAQPTGLAVGRFFSRVFLFVANRLNGTIGRYELDTGTEKYPRFIQGLEQPTGLAVDSRTRPGEGPILFVANFANGKIGQYGAFNGSPLFDYPDITSNEPEQVALLGDELFVVSAAGMVGDYHTRGYEFNPSVIEGLTRPIGVAVR